ncbi:cell wall hydrolase [Sphingomonas lenta]|uniref:cell wall hydrolase n=1 Tax=Sphingomonas lenta TaxID=1141887 RepID=UPI001FE515B2|nr:cell wall hydrolase [Sphingomonas lenta]
MAALVAPALIVRNAPAVRPVPRAVATPQRVVPPAEIPPVEPTRFVEIAPEDARAINATVPFSAAPNPAARPFSFAGSTEDLARATDCLAAAVIYEAGDDAPGERAVAQVIINRLRHPAFPKTICGVVFQGQERSTGCQFTFTCDGALNRWRPTEAGWRRAREIATMALRGSVYRPVGHATHYHTDWVVPYWSSSLDKITAVGTHLFFRWTGWWGTPPAFNRRQAGPEPAFAKMAALSPAHASGVAAGEAVAGDEPLLEGLPPAAAEAAVEGAALPDAEMTPDANSFLITLPATVAPDLWHLLANKICGARRYCKVLGWVDPKLTPARLPLNTAQVASLSFSYLRDDENGLERRLWNCREFKRPVPAQCMRAQVFIPTGETIGGPADVQPPAVVPTRGPGELDGVRRRSGPPAPAPSPTPSAAAGAPKAATP